MMHSRVISILLIVTLSYSLSSTSFCQPSRANDIAKLIHDNASWDYREFALEKLRSNRILMLADEGHGVGLYMHTVIDVLNEWVTTCESEGRKGGAGATPRKLYLVLEIDSARADAIRKYFVTGNLIEALEPEQLMGNQTTTAWLEFLSDLRDIRLRVDSLNRGFLKDHSLQFDIFGPEKRINILDWSVEKRDRYFIGERDEYSSAQVIKLLDNQPDARAVIFYGSAHCFLGLQEKKADKISGKGYYLAHYLTEHFRNNGGVYVCDQYPMTPSFLDDAFAGIDKSFAIENSYWEGIAIGLNSMLPRFDGTIFIAGKTVQSRHISKILSENLIDLILQKIDRYGNTGNEFSRFFLKTWFDYLANFTEKDYAFAKITDSATAAQDISALKAWRRSTKLDIVQALNDLSIWKKFIESIRKLPDPQSTHYQMLLADFIGFKVWYQNGATSDVRADATWKYINKYRHSIVIDNLVALLWIGTEEEKRKALSILKDETHQEFRTAKEWSRWLAQTQ